MLTIPRIFAKYAITRIVASGSTSAVAEVITEGTRQIYAVKVFGLLQSSSFPHHVAIEREVRVLQRLDHKHVVKLVDVIRERDMIFLVMENCTGGTLLDHVLISRGLNLIDVKRLFRQIVLGVRYLHSQGIAHGDLKPENVGLTSNGDVKLLDFGYCKESKLGRQEDKSGTCRYSAPETFRDGDYDTQKADIWSLGILLFVMGTGTFPYRNANNKAVKQLALRGELTAPKCLDSSIATLYQRMTQITPSKRPTLDAILNGEELSSESLNFIQ
jgi:serine/threonine protein kinase